MKNLLFGFVSLLLLTSCSEGTFIADDLKEIVKKEKIETITVHSPTFQESNFSIIPDSISMNRNYLEFENEAYNLGKLVKYKVEKSGNAKALHLYF